VIWSTSASAFSPATHVDILGNAAEIINTIEEFIKGLFVLLEIIKYFVCPEMPYCSLLKNKQSIRPKIPSAAVT
jgi:hypothetical protein